MQPHKLCLMCSLAGLLLLPAPARSDDWTTLGYDAQRSSWVRADNKTSPTTVRAPDFRFLWKIDLSNEPRSGNSLTPAALLDFLISHRGFRSLAFVGGSSGGVFAMDTDLARMEWERHFLAGPSESSADCPGGMTANLTRPTSAPMPSMLGFGGRGRRSPAASGVGEPGAGAVTLAQLDNSSVRRPSAPQAVGRTRPPHRRSLRGVELVYALSADGRLHALYVSNGRDHVPPLPFLPANANAHGLIIVDEVAYVSTRNGCGDVADGVWALDLESGSVTSWKSDGGPVTGLGGLSFGPDATVYAATKNGSLVALEPASLTRTGASQPVGFRSSPVVIDFAGKDHVVAIARNGSVRVYDATDLGQPLARTPMDFGTEDMETAPAVWRDPSGTHWILAPSRRALVAWKLTASGDGMRLDRGWESPGMDSPLPPIVVNGVVFALDGGRPSGGARLVALDGTTGRQLWDSGDAIKGTARGHALSSGPGHVFLTASDGAVYAFGFPMEH